MKLKRGIKMPLIETDTIYAFLNKKDNYHKYAYNIINQINEGILNVKISSACLIELQLVYKSKEIEYEFETDIIELQRINNVEWTILDVSSSLTAIHLRKRYDLSFFDSLHAGIAINLDKQIISQDKAYDNVAGLKRIPLTSFK